MCLIELLHNWFYENYPEHPVSSIRDTRTGDGEMFLSCFYRSNITIEVRGEQATLEWCRFKLSASDPKFFEKLKRQLNTLVKSISQK